MTLNLSHLQDVELEIQPSGEVYFRAATRGRVGFVTVNGMVMRVDSHVWALLYRPKETPDA